MNIAATLSSRIILLVAGRGASLVLGLVATALLTRYLGPVGFGHYRTAVAYLGLIVILADLGMTSIFVREVSRPGADQPAVVGNALSLRLMIAASFFGVGTGLAWLLDFDDHVRLAIAVSALGFVAYSLHLMMFGLFHQKLRQAQAIVAEIIGVGAFILSIWGLVAIDAGPAPFVVALAGSYLLTAAISLTLAYRLVSYRLRADPARLAGLIRAALPLAGGATLTIIYFRADSILLALLQGPEAVGLYGVPVKIFDSVMGIVLLVIGLFAPLLARHAEAAGEAFKSYFETTLVVVIAGVAAIGLGLSALAQQIVMLLAGGAFADAATTLRLLTIVMVLHAIVMVLREAATAMNLHACLVPAYVGGFVAAFASYVVLIPAFAATGAALALIVAETVVLAIGIWRLDRASPRRLPLRTPAITLLCAVVASTCIAVPHDGIWHGMLIAAVSLFVLAGGLMMTRVVSLKQLKAVVIR